MNGIRSLTVKYHGRNVGTLAQAKGGLCPFQYDRQWLADGFSISPFSLPLTGEVFFPKSDLLEGLFGVFADSLPDGWGRLLVDRLLLSNKISPSSVNALERLGIVGAGGMGALEYFPELFHMEERQRLDFDQLSQECEKILKEQSSKDLNLLFQLGGSSGGARPKVLVQIDKESWIVKFPSSYDRGTIGEEEYRYMECARACGIHVPEARLFPSKKSRGYFGVKRFDRDFGKKIHMATVSGLLETSHRIPNLDYHDLMKLTFLLTKDSRQGEEMYRRMCFNVYAHNRDDHSKNFSYLYDEKEKRWKLTPAYDLTYSSSIGGEHATCVDGNGRNPGAAELEAVGAKAGLARTKARRIREEIEETVKSRLTDILQSY